MDLQKFGTFIAQCRKDKKMTQSDLAAKLNVTDKAISRWERGVPRHQYHRAIGRSFRCQCCRTYEIRKDR